VLLRVFEARRAWVIPDRLLPWTWLYALATHL
jgi:hypothetical protein